MFPRSPVGAWKREKLILQSPSWLQGGLSKCWTVRTERRCDCVSARPAFAIMEWPSHQGKLQPLGMWLQRAFSMNVMLSSGSQTHEAEAVGKGDLRRLLSEAPYASVRPCGSARVAAAWMQPEEAPWFYLQSRRKRCREHDTGWQWSENQHWLWSPCSRWDRRCRIHRSPQGSRYLAWVELWAPKGYACLNPQDVTLLEITVFADIIEVRISGWSHPGLVGPKPNDKYPQKRMTDLRNKYIWWPCQLSTVT